ncbi:hypothetical protein ABVT39_010453 [Epinephelus coioides]
MQEDSRGDKMEKLVLLSDVQCVWATGVPTDTARSSATAGKSAASEITDLMEAMDHKDNERKRIRLERQVAHEAELQREAQEAERAVREEDRQKWAEQFRILAGMFQEQATCSCTTALDPSPLSSTCDNALLPFS